MSRIDLCAGMLMAPEGGHLHQMHAGGTTLHGAVMTGSKMRRARLSNAVLRRADLRDADLRGSIMMRANLSKADLTGRNLRGADMTGAILPGPKLEGKNLIGVTLDAANLDAGSLIGALLDGVNLSLAEMLGVHLPLRLSKNVTNILRRRATWIASNGQESERSDLTGARFKRASLNGAIMAEARADPMPIRGHVDWPTNLNWHDWQPLTSAAQS